MSTTDLTDEPFLSCRHSPDVAEAFAAAHDIDFEVREMANGKRKPGKLSLEKLAVVLSFVRRAAVSPDRAVLAQEAKRIARHLFDLSDEAEDMAHLSRAIDQLAASLPSPAEPAIAAPAATNSDTLRKLRFINRVLDNFAAAPVSDRASAHAMVRELIESTWKDGRAPPAAEGVQRDSERLDWLVRHGDFSAGTVPSIPHDYELHMEDMGHDGQTFKGENLRECIDAAMSRTAGAEQGGNHAD